MPKAVILYSFSKGDTSPLLKNLERLKFKRTDSRRTVFSKEFSVNEVELDVGQLADIKAYITEKANIMISSPSRIWREAFKSAGLSSEEAMALAGLAMADPPSTSASSTMMDEDMEDVPAAKSIKSQLASDSQSQEIVDDDFDVDALVANLANTKLGGRRHRKTRRGTKKSRRRYSRKAPSLG